MESESYQIHNSVTLKVKHFIKIKTMNKSQASRYRSNSFFKLPYITLGAHTAGGSPPKGTFACCLVQLANP